MNCLRKCRVLVHVAAAAVLSLLLLAVVASALAADAAPALGAGHDLGALQSAHQELTTWLNESENGRGWLRYLEMDELQRQIALGGRADKATVGRIAARFRQRHAGLELPDFRAVAGPLDAWLAELSLPSRAGLPAALRAGVTSFKKPTAEQLAAARQEVRAAANQLAEFLGEGADADGWKRYLRWNDWSAGLEGTGAPNLKTLHTVRDLFAARHAGLDWPQFAHVRLALEGYIAKLSLVEDDGPRLFRQQLEMLANAIQRGDGAPDARRRMDEALAWLVQHDQAPELVRAVRRHFPQAKPAPATTAAAPPPAPVVRLMSAAKDRMLRRLLPQVDDEGLRRALSDPALILYTEDEMPRTYQIWDGQLQGVHSASYNISADRSEPFGNGNHEFPWGAPAGTHRAENTSSFRFLWLPRDDGGRFRPVVWYRQQLAGDANSSYVWSFPVGTIVGEVLTLTGPDGYAYTYEMRLRFRKPDRWGVDVFRPFPTADDLAKRIRELRPAADTQPKVAELLVHLEGPQSLPWRRLADQQPGRRIFEQWAGEDSLPPIGDDPLVKELLTKTTFTSCLDQTWRVGSNGAWTYAPTTKESFHVVPANYDAGFVEVSGRSCIRCHSTCNEHVNRFNFGRDWYGHVRGSDGIFSFHPFDPGTVSGNGFSSGVQMRPELVQAGVLEAYDSQKHPASIYTTVPGL